MVWDVFEMAQMFGGLLLDSDKNLTKKIIQRLYEYNFSVFDIYS
jgi:hypothetical protein